MRPPHRELLDVAAQMETPTLDVNGIDMNNVVNLALYTDIILFKMSPMEEEIVFHGPGPLQQRAIQTWAHSFGFDYEYSIATRMARVVKATVVNPAATSELGGLEFLDFGSSIDIGVAENDLGTINEHLGGLNASQVDGQGLWNDHILWPDSQAPLEHYETEDNCVQTNHPNVLAEELIVEHIAPHKSQTSLNNPLQSDQEENAPPISPSSPHYGRGRKSLRDRFGRRQSVHTTESSGYQEIIFDSGSSRPSSPATPGRRGPLDAAARAAMKAVKAVRACWRCKFLRKPCSPDDPCLRCPASSTKFKEKSWLAVGCNRGSFKEVLPSSYLCPRQISKGTTSSNMLINTELAYGGQADLNEVYRIELAARADALRKALGDSPQSEPTPLVSYLQTLDPEADGSIFKGFQISSLLPVPSPTRVAFTPLEECITAVVYEAVHCVPSRVEQLGDFPHIVALLHSAAKYQAKIDSDELIAQSIICLRSSFEAIQMMSPYHANGITQKSHRICETGMCQIEYIRSLEEHLDSYLDELSKVFFKKENMRVKETWWLSTFYSFAIQGLIRQLIQQLSYDTSSKSLADQYLHLAIRLFIASSGDYDPLTRDYVTLAKGKDVDSSYISDLQEAKNAVDQSSWVSRGILSSADYLRNLFEDNGGDITVNSGMTPARDAAWSSFSPAPSGSRPCRPSSLSSMESSSDITSTASPPAPSHYHKPTPTGSSYFPGSSFAVSKQPTSHDPCHIPVDVRQAIRLADEKRARNAGASGRFRQTREMIERKYRESREGAATD